MIHKGLKALQRDLVLPVTRPRLTLQLSPYERTRPIEDFDEATTPVNLKDQQMLRATPKSNSLPLRCLYLNFPVTDHRIAIGR